MYKAIIAPHFDYCNVVWGRSYKMLQNKLQVLQNRAAKIILKKKRDESSTQALQTLKWENLETKLYHHEAVTMYKIFHNLTPSYLTEHFSFKERKYNTRSSDILKVNKPHTEYKKKSLSYHGANLWNNLSEQVRTAPNIQMFKKLL